jgi:molybdopterin-binding protein
MSLSVPLPINNGTVKSCRKVVPSFGPFSGDVMSLVKYKITKPAEMASVLTTESVEDLDLKVGDEVRLIIKAVHVRRPKKDQTIRCH